MPSDKERYIHFAATTPGLPLSFQPWYLDTVCVGGEWDAVVVEEAQKVVGVWPFFMKKKWGLTYITMPMLTKWMGPWIVPDAERLENAEIALLEELLDKLPKVDLMTINCHPDFQSPKVLANRGFRYESRNTYRLVGEKIGWEPGMDGNIVREFRKVAKTLSVSEEGSLALFCDIHEKTYARQGIPCPVPRDFLMRHLENLKAHQAVRFTFAKDDKGTVYSVLALTWDQHSAYYHISGNDYAAGHGSGSKLLVRDAMTYTNQILGLKTFDFEGSMIENVASVWKRFGAVPVPYYRVQYFRNRWLRMLYRILRA